MLDRTATAWLRRLLTWLEQFEACFGRQSQRGALRRYVTGVLNDSRRKSMEAMWARLSYPGTYQAFQHFITHAPWDAEVVCAVVLERTGVLILDGTSFPKQGTASVGVARQYCGASGKVAKLPDGRHRRPVDRRAGLAVGATLYLPEEWLTPRQRARAQIPLPVQFEPKWQLALTLLRQVRAAGFTVTAVVGDARVRRQRDAAAHVASRTIGASAGSLPKSGCSANGSWRTATALAIVALRDAAFRPSGPPRSEPSGKPPSAQAALRARGR